MAFVAKSSSNINVYSCTSSILERFKSSSKWSRSASTLFLEAMKLLFSTALAKRELEIPSFLSAIRPAAIPLPNAILREKLFPLSTLSKMKKLSVSSPCSHATARPAKMASTTPLYSLGHVVTVTLGQILLFGQPQNSICEAHAP